MRVGEEPRLVGRRTVAGNRLYCLKDKARFIRDEKISPLPEDEIAGHLAVRGDLISDPSTLRVGDQGFEVLALATRRRIGPEEVRTNLTRLLVDGKRDLPRRKHAGGSGSFAQ